MLNQALILVGSIFPFLTTLSSSKTNNVCNVVNSNLVVQYLVEHGLGHLVCQDPRINLVFHACNALMLYYLIRSASFGLQLNPFITNRSALIASLYFALHPSRNWNIVGSVPTINYFSVFLLFMGMTLKLRPNSSIVNILGVFVIVLGGVIYPEPVLMCIVLAVVSALNYGLKAHSSEGRRDFNVFALCGALLLVGGILGVHDLTHDTLVSTRSTQLLIMVASKLRGAIHLLLNVVQIVKVQFCFHSAQVYSLSNESWLKSFTEHTKSIEITLVKMITSPASHAVYSQDVWKWSSAGAADTLEAYVILGVVVLLLLGVVGSIVCGAWCLVTKKSKNCTSSSLCSFWMASSLSYLLICLPTALRCVDLLHEVKGANKATLRSIEQRLVATWAEGAYMSAGVFSIALGMLLANYFKPSTKSTSDSVNGQETVKKGSAVPTGVAGVVWRVLPYFLLLMGLQSYLQTNSV